MKIKIKEKTLSKRSPGKLKTGKGVHSSKPAGKENQETTPPVPENEAERLALLHSLNILDTQPEQAFDDIATLAASICNTPIALVTLVDENRQWFKIGVPPAVEAASCGF